MGLFDHVIKGAGVDPDDGEILGEYTWDSPRRGSTMHGSPAERGGRTAQGNLRRMNEHPGQDNARGGRRP